MAGSADSGIFLPEEPPPAKGVTRRPWRNCVRHYALHYTLPRPVEPALGELFPAAETVVNRFSRFVAVAKDQLAIIGGGDWRAVGVVGERELVVTFFHGGADDPPPHLAVVEAALTAAYGPIRKAAEAR